MEQHTTKPFYPICNDGTLYPENLSKILAAFYTSNKKQFTKQELQHSTNLSDNEIEKGIQHLIRYGEIVVETSKNVTKETFYFSTDGNAKNLKLNIKNCDDVILFLEDALRNRNISNPELNDFMKAQIIFYSEILDFMMVKFKEHFNPKKAH